MCALLVGLPDVTVVGVGDWPLWLRVVVTDRRPIVRRAGAVVWCIVTVSARWCSWIWRRSAGRRGWCGASNAGAAAGGRCWCDENPEIGTARCADDAGGSVGDGAGRPPRPCRCRCRRDLGCGWHAVMDAVVAVGEQLIDHPDRIGSLTALGWTRPIVVCPGDRAVGVLESRALMMRSRSSCRRVSGRIPLQGAGSHRRSPRSTFEWPNLPRPGRGAASEAAPDPVPPARLRRRDPRAGPAGQYDRASHNEVLAVHITGAASNGPTEMVNLVVEKVRRVERGLPNSPTIDVDSSSAAASHDYRPPPAEFEAANQRAGSLAALSGSGTLLREVLEWVHASAAGRADVCLVTSESLQRRISEPGVHYGGNDHVLVGGHDPTALPAAHYDSRTRRAAVLALGRHGSGHR